MKLKDFLKERTAIVGLDIAEDQIRVATMEKTASIAASPETVTKALRQLWATNKIKSRRVNLTIHGSDLLLHIVTIPHVKDAEIQSVLRQKVNQYVAFAGVKTAIGWEKIGDVVEVGERKLKILLAVVKRERVDSYIKAVEKAGLFINAIAFPSLASLRALKLSSSRGKKIFVDVEKKQTFIHILERGAITFVHTHNAGADLADDLRKVLQRAGEIKNIIFHVADEGLRDLAKQLGEKLGKPVEVELNKTAQGLAGAESFKTNLLPEDVREREEWRHHIAYSLGAIIGVSLFMLVLFFLFLLAGFILNMQISKVKGRLDNPTIQFAQLKEIENKTKEVKKLIAGRRQLVEKFYGFTWDDIFAELTGLVPEKVYLTKIGIGEEDIVSISGVAKASDYIFDFMNKLKSSKHFKNVDLQIVQQQERAGKMISFRIYAEKNE